VVSGGIRKRCSMNILMSSAVSLKVCEAHSAQIKADIANAR